jgi:tetratricopeptide (TPR) repeat protein
MNAQRRLLLVSALLVISLASSTLADVLVLKNGTLIEGDVDSLLRGTNKAIQTPDGRSVGLSDAVATHLGVTAKELKAGIDRSSFISDRVRIDLVEAFIFETSANEKREQFLQVNVNVTNRDERRYLNIETPGFFSNNYKWRLKDDVSNEVRKSGVTNDLLGELKLLSSLDRIKPEKTANGGTLFEPPLPKTEYLVLDLAPQMFEFNDRLAFIGTAFLLIPFDSVTTPESRLLPVTNAVERYERTAADADQAVAKKLLDRIAKFGDRELANLNARWKLVPFEHAVSHIENTSQSIDWSTIDALRAASKQASDKKFRDSLRALCRRAALAIVKHGEATLETNPDSALQDYRIARLLSVDSNAKAKTPATPELGNAIPRFSRARTATPKTEKFGGIERFRPDPTPKTKTSLARDERLQQELTLRMKTPLPSLETGSISVAAVLGETRTSEQTSAPSLRAPLSGLRKRTALALMKRGKATLETNLDSALQDYWSVRQLIAEEEFTAELRVVLIGKLKQRYRKRVAQGEIEKAAADFLALNELDAQATNGLNGALSAATGSQRLTTGSPRLKERFEATRLFGAAITFQNQMLYDLAIDEWQTFLKKFPGDSRVDEALLNLGLLWYRSAQESKKPTGYMTAIQNLERLISMYPQSEHVERAIELLAEIIKIDK